MKKTWLVVGLVVLAALAVYVVFNIYNANKTTENITTFDECVTAGYAVQESNPARCVTPEGVVFTSVTDSESGTTSIPTQDPTITKTSFGTPQPLTIGQTTTFTDGLLLTLKEVTDSRCPGGAVCVWEGEQGTLLTISGGSAGKMQEIRLGTVTMPVLTQSGYTFILGSVTGSGATITVTKNAGVATGMVQGTVTVGPICPVESIEHPCVVSSEVYTSRSVVVYQADKTTVIKRQPLSTTGTYTLALPVGTYWLQIDPAGIGEGEKKRAVVTSSSATTVDFDVDTGIR